MARLSFEQRAARDADHMPFASSYERSLWEQARARTLEIMALERRCDILTGLLCLVPALLIIAFVLGQRWGR